MDNLETEFLGELETHVKRRRSTELWYQSIRLRLMISIAACGFLTAAASRPDLKSSWISTSNTLLFLGLLSAICAIVNQGWAHTKRRLFHESVKKAFQCVCGEVKFST
jgi:hypothetical protein